MLKRDKPGLILGMAGCVAQQEGEKVLKRYKGLDLVFGSSNIENIPQMIETITLKPRPVVMVEEPPGPPKTTPADRKEDTSCPKSWDKAEWASSTWRKTRS